MTSETEQPRMERDPVETNPGLYRVVFENERVRVLEYRDEPGARTTPHAHPDSIMVTLSTFRRRLVAGGREAEVELQAGTVRWLAAQEHVGENIGQMNSHAIFVELKEAGAPPSDSAAEAPLGPTQG